MMEQNLFDFRPNQTCLGDHNDEEEMGRGGKTTSGNEWTGLEFGKSQRSVENRQKIEKTGCKIICGSPTTLAVKGLMMMMMNDNDADADDTNANTNHQSSSSLS